MIWPFKRTPKSVLGIDIGTSAVKVVELAKYGEQVKLQNYASLSVAPFYKKNRTVERKDTLLFSSKEIADLLNLLFKKAKISPQKAILAIPDFVTFFTSFTLPPMSKEEIPQAVRFEARRHVPLPLSEVTLDWMVTEGKISDYKNERLKILLVVVPNTAIDQYREIIKLCQFELLALEAEVFGLQRALVKEEKKVIALIDIGARSTTCTIVDGKVLKVSHSFDIAGNDFTKRLAESLDLEYKRAEEIKKEMGILEKFQDVKEVLTPLIDLIISEVEKVVEDFYQQEGKEVETYIIAGGSALLPGLKDYFSKSLKKEVKLADPFADLLYPPILEDTLKKMGPAFSIAVGMGLRGLE